MQKSIFPAHSINTNGEVVRSKNEASCKHTLETEEAIDFARRAYVAHAGLKLFL